MFDFQKLEVYQKALRLNTMLNPILRNNSIDRNYRDQLRRAAFSVSLNIAEGTSRFTNPDRRNFYIISRGSTYECMAIIDHLFALKEINEQQSLSATSLLEEISKMLYSLINKLGTAKIKY